ncbi:hypothetical protein [Photorhabdus luminescens]|uniref:hypothetical protein n=1 Tax=Photorhabdus akhurstii TaxID=171438 RepID=UPI00058F6888|nr:hypothetical protein C6H65_15180 [Photorhabdus luminescens]
MFEITKNKSVKELNISVQVDNEGIFDIVPMTPHNLHVDMNDIIIHAPGYESVRASNANGLYVVFKRPDEDFLRVEHFD